MADKLIEDYLKENLKRGYELYDLCNALVASGHAASAVKEAVAELAYESMPKPPQPPVPEPPLKKPLEKKQVPLAFFLCGVVFFIFVIVWLLVMTSSPTIPEEELLEESLPEASLPFCASCEYLEKSTCKKAACCGDEDCEDGVEVTADTCQAVGTKDAQCIRSTIICGNKNCEKGESCCLDCGCDSGFVCIENACVSEA